jgi:hypothetical protein
VSIFHRLVRVESFISSSYKVGRLDGAHLRWRETYDRVMAEHLASIFGTEKDRVNCPFYFKIGACRHGDRCSRMHNRPTISPTLLFSNMYQRPDMAISGTDPHAQNMDPRRLQEHFEVIFSPLQPFFVF